MSTRLPLVLVNGELRELPAGDSVLIPVNILSSSYALTSSYALNGGSGGTSLNTGSTYPITSSWSNNSNNSISSSYAATASAVVGGAGGYAPVCLRIGAASFPWNDNDVYYLNILNSTSYSEIKPNMVPCDGTIRRAWVVFSCTSGSNETVTVTVRKNSADTTIVLTTALNVGTAYAHATASIAVSAGDSITARVNCPTWATNPSSTVSELWVIIEPS